MHTADGSQVLCNAVRLLQEYDRSAVLVEVQALGFTHTKVERQNEDLAEVV